MELSTKITIPKSKHPIDYHSKIMAFGSCFAQNMGAKFEYFKFHSTTNPFGIVFHPLAIEKLIHFALSKQTFSEKDIFFHNERWHCFDAHSQLSHPDQEVFLQNLNEALHITRNQIKESTHFILTLGTAWVYKLKKSGDIVANCHKVPQNQFEKLLLSVTEIEESLQQIVEKVKKTNPKIQFIFTISPVRHLKDGFVENQRSKAHLIAAIHQYLSVTNSTLLKGGGGGEHYYFPSFEILMDELRDYRFYAGDMLHPNQVAVNYIWERFSDSCFSETTVKILQEVESIQNGLNHIPFNVKSESHQKFLKTLQEKINLLQQKIPHILFSK